MNNLYREFESDEAKSIAWIMPTEIGSQISFFFSKNDL